MNWPSATRLLVVAFATLTFAAFASQLASATSPVLAQVSEINGNVTATWTKPLGVESTFIEVSRDATLNKQGGFNCCSGPFFENAILDAAATSWTGTRALEEPGTYYVHVSGLDRDCFFAGNCPVREWSEIKNFTFGDPGGVSKTADPPTGDAIGPIESRYVAQLREVAKEVRAALADVNSLSGTSSQLTWVRQTPKVNPGGGEPPGNWTVSASDGQIQVTVTDEPQAAFTGTWDVPPERVSGGTDFAMKLTVNGQITSGTTQGFRNLSLIEIISGRWTNDSVGAGVNCVDPIGTEPLSCSGPGNGEGTFNFVFPTSGDTYTFAVGTLNCSACAVEYTYTAQTKETTLAAAGQTLGAAIARAKTMLKTYQRADTRHGTAEEKKLVNKMLTQLRNAGRTLGKLADSPVRTTPKKRSLAEKLLRKGRREIAAAVVEEWPVAAKAAALLKNPGAAPRVFKRELIGRIGAILDRNRDKIVNRALKGLPIQLGAPLRPQIHSTAVNFLLRKIGPGLLKLDPRGLVLQFFANKISIALKDIALAFRPTGKVVPRTNRTLRGYARHETALKSLRNNVNSDLGEVQAAVAAAEGAFDAARLLRNDLDRLVKRRCKNAPGSDRCQGAQKTKARLVAADKSTKRQIKLTKQVFLLGKQFDPAQLRAWVKGLCALEKSVKRINAKLA